MQLLGRAKKQGCARALIDIGSASVGGAYAVYDAGAVPTIVYTARVAVERREGEEEREAMLRSLAFLEKLLIEEGAPTLRRERGSGEIQEVLVSVSAPWQDTIIASTKLVEEKPFVFSHAHLEKAMRTLPEPPEGRILSGRTLIASTLNGYETPNPFGKKVTRAELVILSSTIEKETGKEVEASLRHTFHTHAVTLTGFGPVAYAAFQKLYPHQKDFMVLDVSGASTDVAFVKRGHLAGVASVPLGLSTLYSAAIAAGRRTRSGGDAVIDPETNRAFGKEAEAIETAWLEGLRGVLSAFSETQALPRMVFLLADDGAREYLKRTLEESALRSLWLSGDPLSVVAMAPGHYSNHVRTKGIATCDLPLVILALSAAS